MIEIIPSSKSNYIRATDGYENLIAAFKKIESSISGGATKTVISKDGMVELDEIKSIESVAIKVNGKIVSSPKSHLKEQSGKTFVDLTTFDANAKIEVEYTANWIKQKPADNVLVFGFKIMTLNFVKWVKY